MYTTCALHDNHLGNHACVALNVLILYTFISGGFWGGGGGGGGGGGSPPFWLVLVLRGILYYMESPPS